MLVAKNSRNIFAILFWKVAHEFLCRRSVLRLWRSSTSASFDMIFLRTAQMIILRATTLNVNRPHSVVPQSDTPMYSANGLAISQWRSYVYRNVTLRDTNTR